MKKEIAVLFILPFFTLADAYGLTRGGSMQRSTGDELHERPARAVTAPLPIPNSPEAVTIEHSRQLKRDWYVRTMLVPYQKSLKPDPKAIVFIRNFIESRCRPGTGPLPGELEKEIKELESSGIDDPLLAFLGGALHGDPKRKIECFRKALSGFSQSSYSKFLMFLASANLGKALQDSHAEAAELDECDNASLQFLSAALDADSFRPDEMALMPWQLVEHPVMELLSRRGAEICAILEKSAKVEPWVAQYYDGLRFIKEAWKARGTGFADTVTEDGWKGFTANIALAREHLVKSWELNPKNPMAATEMITVTMAENEALEPMRLWFDRAVAAEMDYESAYSHLLGGLYPKWGGEVMRRCSALAPNA